MESDRTIKISVIIKKVKEINPENEDNKIYTLSSIKDLLERVSEKGDESKLLDIIHLLNASKKTNEIMGDAFCDVNREDLLNEKMESNDILDNIINQIINI